MDIKGRRGSVVLVIALVVVVALAAIGGIWYYEAHNNLPPSRTLQMPLNVTSTPTSTSGTVSDNALLSPLTGSAPLTVTANIPYGNCDGFSINWGDNTTEGLGAGPGCKATSVEVFSNQHSYQKAGTYTVVANTVGGRSISETVNVIESGNSKTPQILSPSSNQVITIGETVHVAWDGIDGVYNMVATAPTHVASGDDVVVGLRDVLGDQNTREGNTAVQAAYNIVPNTGSFLWDTTKVPPGEYSLYVGADDSEVPWVTPVWFVPAQSSNVVPTVTSADAAYIPSATTTVSDSYSLTVHGTHFTPASYVYLMDSDTPYGSLLPTSISSDGTSLTVSPVTSYAGQTWSVRVYNGTHESDVMEFVTPYPG